MRSILFAVVTTLIAAPSFSQIVGGHGNSDPSPKAAQPASISTGGFAGDVNLFTGDYGATIPIGGVSAPGGLGFQLSYEYSSAFTVGATPPISTGIPYGEGWNLNIPTISVETEVFNNFTAQQYCDENNALIAAKLDFGTVTAKQEGDLYWFSPFVNIPGVASGRAVFKYIDVADNQTAVFVLNAFESQVELRYNRNGWKVITADGNQYVFSTAMQSANAPANRRTLYYDQGALTNINNVAKDVQINNVYGSQKENVANSITPKTSYNLWYCDEIRNLNLKEQNILFVYEKFGAFNYFKEFQQEAYKTAAATLFQNTTFSADNDYTYYTDVILKRIESHAVNSMVQMLKLNYETNKTVINANPELMPYYNSNFDGGRLDSLYTYKVVYQDGIAGDFGGGWNRYQHLRANASTMGSTMIDPANPYLSSSGYVRSTTGGTSEIQFDHSFLETPRIGTSTYDLIPGDVYEVKTKIKRSNATSNLQNGNGTIDIAVVTGDNNNPLGTNNNTYSDFNNNNGIYFTNDNYEETRGIPLYSTFNMALKWTLSYSEGVKQTSNLFVMPNIPSKFGGINIQVGPGNSDNNYDATPISVNGLVTNNIPDANMTYVFRNGGRAMKSAADVPGSFGAGLPWGIMLPIYKNMATILNTVTYSSGTATEVMQMWWNGNPALYNYPSVPTKLDTTVKLDEIQLIRYTKNPYMLTSAELYQVNGEINTPTNDGLKLIAKKKMEYSSKRTQLIENYDYSPSAQLKYKNANQYRQVHILLKAVRDIPVDGTTDTTKFLTTFLGYSDYVSADSTYDQTKPLNGHKGIILTSFIDHLGGITKVEYYPPTDARTYATNRYVFNQTCNSMVYTKPYGMNKASTIHPVVQYILKNDELDLVKNSSPSSNVLHKRWRYDFDVSTRIYKNTDITNDDVDHFHHGKKSSYSVGFKKVSVYGPNLDGSNTVNKTVYEHYGHQLTEINNPPTDEDYLLHGKIKSIKEYDFNNKLFTEKIINYGYTLAFMNGYTRPNPYKTDIIWDQDFDNPGGHYEYRDYYLNEPVSVTTGGNTYTGTNAYEYLTIPVFNGTGESKEMPKFLDFAFYPDLDEANDDVKLHSYFIKKTEEINRSYDDYLYKQATQSPIVLPVVVSTLPNPFGGGHTNTTGYEHTRDSVYFVNIATGTPKDVTTALMAASPLSDSVMKVLISSTRFSSSQKAEVLKTQSDLSNAVWVHTLNNVSSFSSTDLIDLVNKQTYFSDAILNHAINNMDSRWDQPFLEKLFMRNDYLSHPVVLNLVTTSNYISAGSITTILSKQPQMHGSVLSNIISGSKVPKTSLSAVFKYQTMTDTLFNQLIANTGVSNTTITEIIENGLSYPNEATFLTLFSRSQPFGATEMQRIVVMANRQLEQSIITQIQLRYSKHSWANNIVYNGNPLSQYCDVAAELNWSYIENKTTYEYYEADYHGVAQGRAYKVLMGLEDIPNRTVSYPGSGVNKTISTLNLKHEPSWQVFAVTTSSIHLPDAKQEQQFFYLYDLKNRYDRYWYNYDIKTINGESSSFLFSIEESDTIGYTGRWGSYYASEYAQGNFDMPKYDGMTKSRQYNLRSTPFQKTTITKSQRNEPAMARSEYYFYDARWRFDDLVITSLGYDGPDCPTVPPTPTLSDCEQCMYWKYGLENDLLNSLPNNYCLWQDDVIGFYACPYGIDASQCFPGATLINCNPSLPENQIPDPQRYIQLSDALSKSLQLRSTIVQLDTIMGILNTDFATKRTDRSNKYVAEFSFVPNTTDPNGFDGIYKMVYPFDTITTTTVKERNSYFQPALTVNQGGIKTRYYYNKPQQYWNYNESCDNPAYNFLYNYSSVDAKDIGLPYRVTVGYQRNDSLSSTFEFTNDGQVKKTTNPSGHYFEYTFDGFNRLSTVKENGQLLSRNAYNQWNHNGTLSFNDRIDQNYVYSVLYNDVADTNAKEFQKAFLDPLGRTAGAMKMYNDGVSDQKIYTGTPTYDSWGRVVQTRKPFVTSAVGMQYRSNAVSNVAYSTTQYENDPGSLATRISDIGTAISSDHVVKTQTWIVNNIYASCELELTNYELQLIMNSGSTTGFRFKRTLVTDQDGNESVVYTNAFGQKIATIGWANYFDKIVTLFVYDNYGNLTKTINAKRQETDYKYNILGQLYQETTVDGGSKRFLYNKLGQISAVQDQLDRNTVNGSNISTPRYRKFTYDDYGKPTGQYWVTTTYHQDAFLFETTSLGSQSGYYYDAQNQPHYLRYTFTNRMTMDWLLSYRTLNNSANDSITATGLPIATSTVTEKTTAYGTNPAFPLAHGKVVETKSFNNNVAVQKITFTYDAFERVASQLIRQHPTNETTNDNRTVVAKIDYPDYNRRGSLQEERLDMGNDGTVDMVQFYRYDRLNRLTDVRVAQNGSTAYANATQMAWYDYSDTTNAMKVTKYSVDLAANNNLQIQDISYAYDIRDRLKSINSALMSYNLYYDAQDPVVYNNGSVTTLGTHYNGNIRGSRVQYNFGAAQVNNSTALANLFSYETTYGYSYDKLNRLINADAAVGDYIQAQLNNPSNPTPSDGKLIGDESMAYDKIGNITTLRRVKTAQNMNLGFTVDEFIYQYANGNNRLTMADGINGAADRNYTYDANGNLLTDDSKTISATQYIRGSYANQITKGSDQITYQYDAGDLRYYKKVVAAGVTAEEMYVKDALGRDLAVVKWVGNNSPTTEYYVFGSNRIATLTSVSGAIVTPNEATFFLYDHLGNTRVAFQYSGSLPTVVNAMDYYPYGKTLRVYDNGNGDRYLSTGHERDGETGLDYRGARYYDSDVARFLSTDPWAAKYPQWSTYNYVMGNPVVLIDPTGKGPIHPLTGKGTTVNAISVWDWEVFEYDGKAKKEKFWDKNLFRSASWNRESYTDETSYGDDYPEYDKRNFIGKAKKYEATLYKNAGGNEKTSGLMEQAETSKSLTNHESNFKRLEFAAKSGNYIYGEESGGTYMITTVKDQWIKEIAVFTEVSDNNWSIKSIIHYDVTNYQRKETTISGVLDVTITKYDLKITTTSFDSEGNETVTIQNKKITAVN